MEKFSIEKAVRNRISVRTYEECPIAKEEKEKILAYMKHLENPFGVEVSFQIIETEAIKTEKLGTYGMIKGAKDFIGATVKEGEFALEALGYSFEELILYITSLGIGTCWLGGTFNKGGFSKAMGVKENDIFPAITPIGYPVEKRSVKDSLVRWAAKSDKRKAWEGLFYFEDFSTDLDKSVACEYGYALEMLRLAPSAANKQPWRVLFKDEAFHFYEAKSLKEDKIEIDIQRVDLGIGFCHFHKAAIEKDLTGKLIKLPSSDVVKEEKLTYLFSWVLQ